MGQTSCKNNKSGKQPLNYFRRQAQTVTNTENDARMEIQLEQATETSSINNHPYVFFVYRPVQGYASTNLLRNS